MRRFALYSAYLLVSAIVLSSELRFVLAGDFEEVEALKKQVRDLNAAGHHSEAEPLARKMVAIAERSLANRPLVISDRLTDLGNVLGAQGKYEEAITIQKRSIEIHEKELGVDDVDLGFGYTNLGISYWSLGRHDEAESSFNHALKIISKSLGDEHPNASNVFAHMAGLYRDLGRYADAEKMFNRALAIDEKAFGEQSSRFGRVLGNFALLVTDQGRYLEAEQICNRALKIKEKTVGPDHPSFASTLSVLGRIHTALSHNAQAESFYRRALSIDEKSLGDQHEEVAAILANLACLFFLERRYDDAEPFVRRSLAINEKIFGEVSQRVAFNRTQLADIHAFRKHYSEAEPLYNRAIAITEKVFGKEHFKLTYPLLGLAHVYCELDRLADAESLYKLALSIAETSLGQQNPEVAYCLRRLSSFYHDRQRDAEAEELIDRAIVIHDRAGMGPYDHFDSYLLRSRIGWKLDRKNEALRDLRQALDSAEQVRNQSLGADIERAESFTQFSDAFEQMVAWQLELSDAAEALVAIERGRARSLLDEMNRVGSDLNVGRSAVERKAMQEKESQLKSRVAQLEKQVELASEAKKEDLKQALTLARKELYEQYRDERSSSPVYRNLLSTGSGPPRISQLQRTLLTNDGLALVYLFGKEAGYLVLLNSKQVRTVPLSLDGTQAKVLGTSTGPLTNDRLQEILIGKDNSGIVPQLATPPTESKPENLKRLTARLAALWQILIPESERDALTSGQYKRLIVVPDGPLALFPFESLVVQGEQDPEYLLDRGPSIHYGPSLSVLYNLSSRSKLPQAGKPVLTVADPIYAQETHQASVQGSSLTELASHTRYAESGGQLSRLPYTAEESNVVKDVFSKVGLVASSLMREQATEGNVRQNIAGRKIVHLACHGLTDQAYGNFFGALALTPGKTGTTDSADDGFLTLPEIYELDMKGCELAILSACQTNYGPRQQGEGVWALSRGFLVSGAKRVVASNWLVNDEAGARLIQYYCTALADDEKNTRPAEYARQLQSAKKWVRSQPRWKHPYFWSTFVLVGPN